MCTRSTRSLHRRTSGASNAPPRRASVAQTLLWRAGVGFEYFMLRLSVHGAWLLC